QNQDDSDDEKGDVDDEIESIVAGNKNNKVITAHVSSMRIDAVVKAGMDASDHPEGYKLKLLREKSLTIENYGDSWKPSEDSNS
ncbi:hypothetical protein G9C98_003920, partial [Cotesia typhae]